MPDDGIDGVAMPVSPGYPLPVTERVSIAIGGSGTITCGCSAQLLFGGIVPKGGYLVCNNSRRPFYISEVGTAPPPGHSDPHRAAHRLCHAAGLRPAASRQPL